MGAWMWMAALGCTPKGATEGPPTVTPGEAQPEAVAAAQPPASTGPTQRLEALRHEIAEAGDALDPERCTEWSNGLVELHRRHGEPYVGARLEAASLMRDCDQPDVARGLLLDHLDTMPRWARAEALNTLGVLAHEAGDDGDALVLFHEALRADPALHEARANVVRLLLQIYEQGGSRFARDDAQRHLDAWLELAPEDPRVRVLEARLMVSSARREPEAAEGLRQEAELQLGHVIAVRSSPVATTAEAHVVQGQLLLDHGNEIEALKAFKRALELDPGRADAALPGATAALHMRDFSTAREMLEAAARTVDPGEEHERLRLLAVALRALRRYEDAAAIYDQLLAGSDRDPIDVYNRAHLELYRFEDSEEFEPERLAAAREWFTKAIAAAGSDPAHAELVRRSQEGIAELDQLASDIRIHRALYEEAVRLEEVERKAWPEERKRRLKLEKKAREAHKGGKGPAAPAPAPAPAR